MLYEVITCDQGNTIGDIQPHFDPGITELWFEELNGTRKDLSEIHRSDSWGPMASVIEQASDDARYTLNLMVV